MADQTTRTRAKLDFGDFDDFKPSPKPSPKPKPSVKIEREIAAAEGFTSRQPARPPKPKPAKPAKPAQNIDGRTLRATGRTVQLNIAVKAETKNQFWSLAQAADHTRGEELLLDMMAHWQASGPRK